MTLADAVAALERGNEKLREDRDEQKARADRLQRELNEALAVIEDAEAMRAKCEAIARDNAKFWGTHTNRGIPCIQIADEIAALNGNGEG